ncbi:hypothetical protein RI367_002634 [Sorochytrium milnesiophthora]
MTYPQEQENAASSDGSQAESGGSAQSTPWSKVASRLQTPPYSSKTASQQPRNRDCEVFVLYLPVSGNKNDLQMLFEEFGKIASSKLFPCTAGMGDYRYRRAIVELETPEAAEAAVAGLDGHAVVANNWRYRLKVCRTVSPGSVATKHHLLVTNLPLSAGEDVVRGFLQDDWTVASLKMYPDPKDRSHQRAEITFDDISHALDALPLLNQNLVQSTTVYAFFADEIDNASSHVRAQRSGVHFAPSVGGPQQYGPPPRQRDMHQNGNQTNLYLSHLPRDLLDSEFRSEMEKFGQVKRYTKFVDPEVAQQLVSSSVTIQGYPIRARYYVPKNALLTQYPATRNYDRPEPSRLHEPASQQAHRPRNLYTPPEDDNDVKTTETEMQQLTVVETAPFPAANAAPVSSSSTRKAEEAGNDGEMEGDGKSSLCGTAVVLARFEHFRQQAASVSGALALSMAKRGINSVLATQYSVATAACAAAAAAVVHASDSVKNLPPDAVQISLPVPARFSAQTPIGQVLLDMPAVEDNSRTKRRLGSFFQLTLADLQEWQSFWREMDFDLTGFLECTPRGRDLAARLHSAVFQWDVCCVLLYTGLLRSIHNPDVPLNVVEKALLDIVRTRSDDLAKGHYTDPENARAEFIGLAAMVGRNSTMLRMFL